MGRSTTLRNTLPADYSRFWSEGPQASAHDVIIIQCLYYVNGLLIIDDTVLYDINYTVLNCYS